MSGRGRSVGPPGALAGHPWGWYALSFLVPMAGFCVAYFLYDQEPWEVRRIGRNCLLIAFLVWVFLPALLLGTLLLTGFLALLSFLADLLPLNG